MDQRIDKIEVREALASDSRSIRQLGLEVNIDAWPEADYSSEISRPDSFVLKATVETQLVGFVVARIVPGTSNERPDADLYNIAVDPLYKRRGIGHDLFISLVERLGEKNVENLWLEVRESNSVAISFYKQHGFFAELTRPNFYSNPTEDAVIMRLVLKTESGLR